MIILLPVVIAVIDIISSMRSSSLLNAHGNRTPRFPIRAKKIYRENPGFYRKLVHAVSISILLSETIKMLSKIHTDQKRGL